MKIAKQLHRIAKAGISNFETVQKIEQAQADLLDRLRASTETSWRYRGLSHCSATRCGKAECLDACCFGIPRSRHDPKILWVDDAEIVGDRITKVRPIPRNLFTQKTERRIGELGASCVALVVSDVSVHEAP